MGLWRLLRRLKFSKTRCYILRRMPAAGELPAIERGWTGERAARMLGGGRYGDD